MNIPIIPCKTHTTFSKREFFSGYAKKSSLLQEDSTFISMYGHDSESSVS
jgi:hypothetical protein